MERKRAWEELEEWNRARDEKIRARKELEEWNRAWDEKIRAWEKLEKWNRAWDEKNRAREERNRAREERNRTWKELAELNCGCEEWNCGCKEWNRRLKKIQEEYRKLEEEYRKRVEEYRKSEEEICKRAEENRKREELRKLLQDIKESCPGLFKDRVAAISSETCGLKDREVRIFEIPGLLAERSTKALGDYGAKKNFIKEEYAIRLGLPINRDIVCKVIVGSGKLVTTTGAITAPFRFQGGYDVYNLNFHLLPDCIHDVILGKSFLKFTETLSNLSNFCRRVKERVIKGISQFHLLYLGASSPMFEGSINGQPQTALADSGAKVLVMDETYARSINVLIQDGPEHRTRLKFADNSTADTSGLAYNVEWRFGRDGEFTLPFQLDFHILKNAPANVILCDTFLYDNEAFSRYPHYLVDDDDDYENEDDESHCFAIDVDRRKKRMQTTVTAPSLADLQFQELVRRGKEEDRISALPKDEQTAAQNAEIQRCAEWNRWFATLQANSQAQNLLQQPSATAIPQLQSTRPDHSSTISPQGSGSSPTGGRRFWKWLAWLKRG